METIKWLSGLMGLVVGDALGVPVQFMTREEIRTCAEGPVVGMRGGGVYKMPAGTWSDDSSMALATTSSMCENWAVDPEDIMEQFVEWQDDGLYTPNGQTFDEGNTCRKAINAYKEGKDTSSCGVTGEYANGNGALMRILPVCLFYYDMIHGEGHFADCKINRLVTEEEAIEGIHKVASLTHNTLRSNMCCGYYYFLVKAILEGKKLAGEIRMQLMSTAGAGSQAQDGISKEQSEQIDAVALEAILQLGIDNALIFYGRDVNNREEMGRLGRLVNLRSFKETPESEIKSTGYVVDSLEAAVWCLLTTGSYRECVLKAVNLGEDTDTVAAIAGGLAGLYYGYEKIPAEWRQTVIAYDAVIDYCMDIGDRKFRFGYDPEPYRQRILEIIKNDCAWATQEIIEREYHIEIEQVNGEYEFVEYVHYSNGQVNRHVESEETTYRYILHKVSRYEDAALRYNRIVERYAPKHSSVVNPGGWRLERYEFNRLESGDYSLMIEMGDRNGGSGRTDAIPRSLFEKAKSFEDFIGFMPTAGIPVEELLADEGLRKFLGFTE